MKLTPMGVITPILANTIFFELFNLYISTYIIYKFSSKSFKVS
jgi:hypothetical protein